MQEPKELEPKEVILGESFVKETHRLIIMDGFQITFTENQEIPHWFHRFMMRLLLGWKWEILNEQEVE